MEIVDTHCHLDAAEFKENFDARLSRAQSAKITTHILPGVTQNGWNQILSLCRKKNGLFPALGLHPMFLQHHLPEHINELELLTQQRTLVAIGEIGLDYYLTDADKKGQQLLFEQQLHIAQSAALPVLLHVRKAHDQVLATLRKKQFSCGGIVHAFSGSFQQASQYITLGFTIGLGGTLTYNRAKRIRTIATKLPQQAIVLETDAPDMPPARYKGTTNQPEYILETLAVLAELRCESPKDIARYTTANTRHILNLLPYSVKPVKKQEI